MRSMRNRRNTSSLSKPDSYHFRVNNPAIKFDEWLSSSNSSHKRIPLASDNDFKHWAISTEGFPPGITVDDIKFYGRRKQPAHLKPQDNLRIEEGNIKPYLTEYKRRYQAYRPLCLKPLQDKPEVIQKSIATSEATCNNPDLKLLKDYQKRCVLKRPPNQLEPMKDSMTKTEKNFECTLYPYCERRKLLRRMTALKTEGEMTNETEVRREYKAYLNPERAQMIRRLPSLKIEGDFEPMITEQQDKYTPFRVSKRPIMEKKKTLLKMEGDFDFSTENILSFVPHNLPERPRIRKRSTSLKLDGELEFFPEYRESFVDFHRTRPITHKPASTLTPESGELEKQTETKMQFVNYENFQVPESANPKGNLFLEGEMEILPEYKGSYVNFPRERPFTRRPLNRIKPEGNLQVLNENTEKFLDPSSVEKRESLKPSNDTKIEGTIDFTPEEVEKFKNHETPEKTTTLKTCLKPEEDKSFVVEKAEDKFEYLVGRKEESERRPSSLKLQGEFLFPPDNRKTFGNLKTSETSLRPVRTFKSNPPSPRKLAKERIKFNLEDKKFIPGTPSKRLQGRRSNENIRPIEKNLIFDISQEPNTGGNTETGRNIDFCIGDEKRTRDPMKLDPFFERQTKNLNPVRPKQFEAFHVLDVKGQQGCQSHHKDPLESTSEDENSTYRLEVLNPEKPNLCQQNSEVFLNAAQLRQEAEKRARKRAEFHEKIVRSPKIPNYLLEDINQVPEKCWKSSGKLSPLFPLMTPNRVSFTVLEGSENGHQTSKEPSKEEKSNWLMPGWMNLAPIT